MEVVDDDVSTTEALQDYLATHSAAYLIMGLSGASSAEKRSVNADVEEVSGMHPIGRVASAITQSPRCATCLCP